MPTNQQVQYPRYRTLREKPIEVPIARHQVDEKIILLSRLTDLWLDQIITPHTVRARKNFDKQGNKIKDSGKDQYITHAREALMQGGTVVIAPAAERQLQLKPFRADALPNLLEETKDIPRVGLAFFGHKIEGVTNYEDVKDKNQFGKKHIVTLGYVYTRRELNQFAKQYDLTINEIAFVLMSDLAPQAFRSTEFSDNPKYQSFLQGLKQPII